MPGEPLPQWRQPPGMGFLHDAGMVINPYKHTPARLHGPPRRAKQAVLARRKHRFGWQYAPF